ncbi:class I SAM-dependent methyltransferase [Clostridium sp. 19966]|uniref:class I SAM-dependent methyltransferase n=1 Tax=Clostridium sp. 19966 TaxID=2768166 RepID=UPI0028DF3F6D|nr:class I SAM-dependent methyltransferase [Clostridium sp. 19966]MDT8717695.1 class I SAM-dependent methyltransferase [Clostridium sp. 19966]
MVNSKGWDWEKANQSPWLKPAEYSYFFANKWRELGFKKILDLGSGLGRHSIFFAKQGFQVSAIDISQYSVSYLKEWAINENLSIDVTLGDMLQLPYADNYFDCLFAYHSISHTDSEGMKKIISEIERVLKPGGEIFTSMCSKDSWDFCKSGFPKLDENTVINKQIGPECNVPHFYADREDIINLFHNFYIEKIFHLDYCYINSQKQDSKYYYINAYKK